MIVKRYCDLKEKHQEQDKKVVQSRLNVTYETDESQEDEVTLIKIKKRMELTKN